MKAEEFGKVWDKHINGDSEKSLYFNPENCFIQPKLDGIRGVASNQNGSIHLTSRSGKEIVFLTAIRNEIKEILVDERYRLDGEFYIHKIVDKKGNVALAPERFRTISGACRTKRNNPSPDEYLMEYHVFDLIDTEDKSLIFEKRWEKLQELFEEYKGKKLKIVETRQLSNPSFEELWKLHDKYVVDNYEGAILRDRNNVYSSDRVRTLLKMKTIKDAEFKIVGAESGHGTEKDCVIYILETSKGHKFTCRPRGTFADRKRALLNINKDIGKMYTVFYQEMDEETGIPIHIRGKDIRYD